MATCSATVPDLNGSGDAFYGPLWNSSQPHVDYFWTTYGFAGNKAYWDDGFGWEDPGNIGLPLGRTFNSLWLLTYSAEDWENDAYEATALNWGRRYVRENIRDLRARCGDGTAVAAADGTLVELYLDMWYGQAVPERASTFMHEARHVGGKDHNDKFPAGSVFGAGQPGADSDWNYEGAWMYETLYLWWYFAAGTPITSAMRERARQMGNLYLDNAFASRPPFRI
ncbi:hypothetical protein ACGGAI_06285 [Streptomyces antibioticus]|uniref:hypothetical protein n=1 Tax=Streptomyces antibioticus TaxID=1890 RepID=UPI00196127E8|nr:hypothetical protein [Streptomyces sp. S9]